MLEYEVKHLKMVTALPKVIIYYGWALNKKSLFSVVDTVGEMRLCYSNLNQRISVVRSGLGSLPGGVNM